ncbi:MAG: DUF4270 domain-containing protein [Bacteroidota bacterium]
MNFRELRSNGAAIFFCVVLCLSTSCEKPDRGIGGELLPDSDNINVESLESIPVIAWNSPKPDSVRTSPVITGIVGSYQDPVMGLHKSEIFTQFRLPASNIVFEEEGFDLELDSVILNLEYTGGFYGFLNPLTFQVFELSENLSLDSIYYSNIEVETFSDNLVIPDRATIRPNPTAPLIVVDSVSITNRIRIPLDTDWAAKFIDPSFTDSLATSDTFTSWFKGLHVKTEDNNSALLNVNLTSSNSNLTLHYRAVNDTSNLDRTFSFLINDNAQRVNKFTHDYSTSVVDYYLNDSTLGQQRLFIQAAAGEMIELDLPTIENWRDSTHIAVNKAELVLPIEDVKSSLALPPRLFIVRFDDDGEEASIPDQAQGDTHIDGFLDLENLEYRINITRYFQQVMNGQLTHNGLRIKPSFNASTFNRASIFGFENPEKRAKLVFTYTKF